MDDFSSTIKKIIKNKMACNIYGTINLECLDSIGGIETIYYIQKSKVASITYDSGGTNSITEISLVSTASTSRFQEIQVNESSSSWIESNKFNLENGSQGWEIVLTIIFSKSDANTRALVSSLVKTKCYVIVKSNDRMFLLGYRNGGYFNGGDYTSGKVLSDRNGFQLIFTSFEIMNAPELLNALTLSTTLFTPAVAV